MSQGLAGGSCEEVFLYCHLLWGKLGVFIPWESFGVEAGAGGEPLLSQDSVPTPVVLENVAI